MLERPPARIRSRAPYIFARRGRASGEMVVGGPKAKLIHVESCRMGLGRRALPIGPDSLTRTHPVTFVLEWN